MSDLASRSEAALRALMRADRQVRDNRRADQAAVGRESTKEFGRAPRRPRRPDPTDDKIKWVSPENTPAECKVCGAGQHRHCFMSGAFLGCPRDLGKLPVVSLNPTRDKRPGADMTGKTNANSLGAALVDRNDGLQVDRRVPRSNGVAFDVPPIRNGGSRQTSSARGRQGGARPQKRAPDYPVVAAWSGFLLFIGVGAFALGMAIHDEAIAQQHTPRSEPIYYCATGVETPPFEPCKEWKGQKDI